MNLTMRELRELLASQCSDEPAAQAKPCDGVVPAWRIVVLQRGWVVVGNVSQSGDDVLITDSSVIRNWGTSKGLGELALNGPQTGTKLDPCGVVRAHVAAIVLQMESDGAKWRK